MKPVRHRSALLTLMGVAVLATACASTLRPSVSGSAAQATATEPSSNAPAPTSTAEASASPTNTTSQQSLGPDSIAITTADDLRVRADPTLSSDQVNALQSGTHVFILSGPSPDPADAELEWWEVAPIECEGGCGYHPRIGWVSSGPAKDWLRPIVLECPRSFTSADAGDLNPEELLACHGDQPITLDGINDYWCCRGITLGRTEPAWLAGDYGNPMRALLRISADADSPAWGPELHVNPASTVTLGDRGTVARITGHFDDPAAQECVTTLTADERERYPDMLWVLAQSFSVFGCRVQFVVDAIDVLDSIPLPTHAPQG